MQCTLKELGQKVFFMSEKVFWLAGPSKNDIEEMPLSCAYSNGIENFICFSSVFLLTFILVFDGRPIILSMYWQLAAVGTRIC